MKIQRVGQKFVYKVNRQTKASINKALVEPRDLFKRSFPDELNELKNLRAGIYGTCCDGSVPLKRFFNKFGEKKRNELIENGLSTNIEGYGNSLLKSKWENPISTSGVMSCSVMYFANENTKTHFLYHMYQDINYEKTIKLINEFMPEGFTHAVIVPGEKKYTEMHKKYLPHVFEAIKNLNKNAKINVCHFSSHLPEVVGYMGKVYEIPRQNPLVRFQNSFIIEDVQYNDKLYLIDLYKNKKALRELSKQISEKMLDPELEKTIQIHIKQRMSNLKPQSWFEKFIDDLKAVVNDAKNPYLYKMLRELS